MNLLDIKNNRQKMINQNNNLRNHLEIFFAKHPMKKELVILDVGCADIRPYSDFLIRKAIIYVGIDISESIIAKARVKLQNMPNVLLLKSSIEEFNYPPNYFDVIVCNNMLAYTNQLTALNKIYSLLKKDGICISYFNNTYQYSIYKIFHPFKPLFKEMIHSIIVLINTNLYFIFGFKIFHTIYNRKKCLIKLISNLNPKFYEIETDYFSLPYYVINFTFRK